jgi:transposase
MPRAPRLGFGGHQQLAAGFVTMLAEACEDIVEKRTRRAKNDRIDAVQAARTALAQTEQAAPRERGLREALRQVLVTRQGVLVSRTKAINELKSLIVVAPDHLRSQLRGLPLAKQLDRIERLTSPVGAGVEHRVTISTLRSIAARIRFLSTQTADLDAELSALLPQHAAGPALLAEPGVGPRRRPASGQLVPPRPGPQRSRIRLTGWCRPLEASSIQRSLFSAPRSGPARCVPE